MPSALERLKVLIKSSSPIVVVETLEEMHALEVARAAASDLDLAFFEWSIADGLTRTDGTFSKLRVTSETAASLPPVNNTQPAAGLLAHLRTLTIEGGFVLKDFHRHMDDTVVIRRLREVAQTFCTDRRTIIITAPALVVPPELQNQVEYLDLPLPDQARLMEIVEATYARLRKKLLLARTIDKGG